MAQTKFQYEYTKLADARRNAKKHCTSSEWTTCIVYHPVRHKYIVLMCDTDADLPTRLPIEWSCREDAPAEAERYDNGDYVNALYEMIERGVVALHIVNHGFNVDADSLEDLCAEWIETQDIDAANWDNTP